MIEFDHVSKVYPGGRTAVGDVSLHVREHTTTVLVGTSGSGKTTLMRMVNRMVTPTSGRVLVRGEDIADVDPVKLRRSIGYVLQDGGLFPHRTVLDNIATVPVLEGAKRKDARRRASQLLELVGLDEDMGRRFPAQLSGGQRQRVGVARALANEADILLMDEPFGALDPLVRRDLQREVAQLRDRIGATILFVTHDIDEAFLLGDQVVVLKTGGEVAQIGSPAQILAHPADAFVSDFVGACAARRRLSVTTEDGIEVVTDREGRTLGVLAADDSPAPCADAPASGAQGQRL